MKTSKSSRGLDPKNCSHEWEHESSSLAPRRVKVLFNFCPWCGMGRENQTLTEKKGKENEQTKRKADK